MQRLRIAKWLLIVALVFVFADFGFDKFAHPISWIGWLPNSMDGLLGLSKSGWLQIIGAFEVLLAILIIIPIRRVRQAGIILMVLHLLAVLTQVGWNDVAVRDIGLMICAIALLALV